MPEINESNVVSISLADASECRETIQAAFLQMKIAVRGVYFCRSKDEYGGVDARVVFESQEDRQKAIDEDKRNAVQLRFAKCVMELDKTSVKELSEKVGGRVGIAGKKRKLQKEKNKTRESNGNGTKRIGRKNLRKGAK